MFHLKEDKEPEPLIVFGVQAKDLPSRSQIFSFLDNPPSGTPPPSNGSPAWIKHVIPLTAEKKRYGLWLIGANQAETDEPELRIEQINHYAHQTTLALINIEQANHLRALYLAEMERHEQEHKELATELQDEILASLALVKGSLDPNDTPRMVLKSYQGAIRSIRDMINTLRPTMFTHGLYNGIAALVNELNSLRLEEMQLYLDIPDTDISYPNEVELQIYRIAQQACQNAIQHSRATAIHISGTFEPDILEILVSDDGVGFSNPFSDDLAILLNNHYFGLAGMVERSRLIGASLEIKSEPNKGCRVKITWSPM